MYFIYFPKSRHIINNLLVFNENLWENIKRIVNLGKKISIVFYFLNEIVSSFCSLRESNSENFLREILYLKPYTIVRIYIILRRKSKFLH